MTRRSDIGLRAALLAAAACSGLMAGGPALAQSLSPLPALTPPAAPSANFAPDLGADWGEMSLDDFAGLLGGVVPRPAARPEDLESRVGYLPRPRPRPDWLRAEDALIRAQMGAEAPAADPAASSGDLARADAPAAEAPSTPGLETVPLAEVSPAVDPAPLAVEAAPAPSLAAAPARAEAAPEDRPAARPPAAGPVDRRGEIPVAPAPEVTSDSTAAPAQSAASMPAEGGAAPQLLAVAEPLPILHTSGFLRESYARDRSTREDIFIAADGPEKIAAALDLTQLLLAHMLLPEARSFHETAQGLGVQNHPELHRRWRVQAAMLDTLQGHKFTQPMPEGWLDASLWSIAGKAAPGLVAGSIDLSEAIAGLQHQSPEITTRLLPELFDAALAVGDLRSADMILRGAREATTLPDHPVYHLMMGRLALAYDMPENAFDYFAKAADGRDIAAQRARIAMADLAIARKDPRLLPALAEILREGVNQWRYGTEGLILRARLAQVAEDLGDIPLALDIMGRIRQDHPGTAEAVLAHERGALALAAFAVAVDAQEIGLETYLQSLRHVESFYRLDPIWPIARSALGRAWSRAGLHVAAASEYAALQNDLIRVGAPKPPEAQRLAIPIDEAEAWLQNHDKARAKLALAREGLPKFSDLATRYGVAALQAEVTGAVGTTNDLTTAEHLSVLARAARDVNQPTAAHGAHRGLYLQNALAARPAEALQAALTARDLGDKDFAERSLADLRATPLGAAGPAAEPLGTALLAPMPALVPLSQSIAETMLTRSGEAIEASRALLARPLLAPDQLTAWHAERASGLPSGDPTVEPVNPPRVE